MKLKNCPLLVDSTTTPSVIYAGETYTKSNMRTCIAWEFAAFDWNNQRGFFCKRFDNKLEMEEEEGGSDA